MPSHIISLSMIVVIAFHLASRMISVVRKARQRVRGAIHERQLFARMIGAYSVLFAFAIGEGWHAPERFLLPFLGALFYLASCLLQWRALRDLGAAYSPDIELRQEQTLVQTGLYGWIRHPLLVAGVLETVGMTMALNAAWTTVAATILFGAVILERWKKEEAALIGHFGDAYLAYRQRVGAFFPRVAR
jgi:protein-S-isoprenylcysteine O-methyltransferase Ste14